MITTDDRNPMNRADLWLKIVELLVASIGVAVPTYVAYDLHSKGPSAEKELEVEHSLKLNVTGGLSLVGEKAQLTLAFEGKPVGDIWVVRDVLRNTGRVAVLPGDYIGRIVLSTRRPWKILDVDSSLATPANVVLHWTRESETSFEADPTLLNPGDTTVTQIYLTNLDQNKPASGTEAGEPVTAWNARIINLHAISVRPTKSFVQGSDGFFPFEVVLFGNAVLFTIVAAMLFEFMYINLLIRGGLLARVDWLGIGLFLFVSLLSFSAAESSAWILFPSWWSRLNPSYGINFCVLSVHWSCLIALYLYARGRAARLSRVEGQIPGGESG